MGLEFRPDGDLFALRDEDPHAWLVCPVNCVPGVMGAGLAKAFARRWPELRRFHRDYASAGRLKPGQAQYAFGLADIVVFVATKDHWRDPARLEWVAQGLAALGVMLPRTAPVTVGIPMLGCGLGGLDWRDVRPLVAALARAYPEHRFVAYGPGED